MSLDDEIDIDDKLSEDIYKEMVMHYLKKDIGDNPSREFDKLLLSIANR